MIASKFVQRIIVVLFVLSASINLDSQVILNQENFENCAASTWTPVSTMGSNTWDCEDDGSCANDYIFINGFGSGLEEDWLISPDIDLDAYDQEYFCFHYEDVFDGPEIELYFSADFSGAYNTNSINAANWIQIQLDLYDLSEDGFNNDLLPHRAIDLSTISGSAVYFAFKYQNNPSQSAKWQIDNIRITADYYEVTEAQFDGGVNCQEFKQTLTNLIKGHEVIPYTDACLDVKKTFWASDIRLNDAGTDFITWDMFVDNPNGADTHNFTLGEDFDTGSQVSGEGFLYNREHTMPKAWWDGTTVFPTDTIYFDLHHITPSDKFLNEKKSSFPPGEVGVASTIGSNGFKVGDPAVPITGYIQEVFEPINAYKGDYARMYFYLATRYGHNFPVWDGFNYRGGFAITDNTFPGYEPWLLQILLEWHESDPVSQKEKDRNNAIFCVQGNRNPFIDHPKYVSAIWGNASGVSCSDAILSVADQISFSVKNENQNARLSWEVIAQSDIVGFEIERSSDSEIFSLIDLVSLEGDFESSYSYIDKNLSAGYYYYRLKLIKSDESFTYSDIQSLNIKQAKTFELISNLIYADQLILNLKDENTTLRVFNLKGETLDIFSITEKGNLTLTLDKYASGTYIIQDLNSQAFERFVIIR